MATKTAPLVPKDANGQEFETIEDMQAFFDEEKKRQSMEEAEDNKNNNLQMES